MEPTVIRTVADCARYRYRVFATCFACNVFHREVNLPRLVMRGKGDKTVGELRIRHACGKRMSLIVSPLDAHK